MRKHVMPGQLEQTSTRRDAPSITRHRISDISPRVQGWNRKLRKQVDEMVVELRASSAEGLNPGRGWRASPAFVTHAETSPFVRNYGGHAGGQARLCKTRRKYGGQVGEQHPTLGNRSGFFGLALEAWKEEIRCMRWGRIGGSVLIILIVEVMVSVVEGAEASYQGKSALYWLDSWSTDAQGASTAFKAMGSNAVSFLTKILEEKPSKLGEFADKRLSEYSIKHPGAVSEEFRRLLPSAYRTENRRETAGYLLS